MMAGDGPDAAIQEFSTRDAVDDMSDLHVSCTNLAVRVAVRARR